MARRTHLTGRFGKPSGLRSVLVLLTLLIAGGVVGTFVYMIRPTRLAQLAGDLIANITGAQVDIASAQLGLDGTIKLTTVKLTIPEMPEGERMLFEADHILINHDMWSLMRGRFDAQRLTMLQPKLYVIQDVATGKFNYQMLRTGHREPGALPGKLPDIFIRPGEIILREVNSQSTLPLPPPPPPIKIEGRLTADTARPHNYYYLFRQLAAGASEAPTASGIINLRDLSVTTELQHFTFDMPGTAALPIALQKWWNQMDPDGSLSEFEFKYGQEEDEQLYAAITIEDVALTLPYINARLTNTSAKFVVKGETITITDLTGLIEGTPYTINGQINGFGLDAPFDLRVDIAAFELPGALPSLATLPPTVSRMFERFNPAGRFEISVRIRRESSDSKIRYRGVVQMTDVSFSYEKFRYPLHDVNGSIEIADEVITIDPVHGISARGPGDASFLIKGQVAPSSDGAVVHITVDATNIRFDDTLINALQAKYRPIIDICGNPAQLERLVGLGLIDPSDQQSGQGLPFKIGGSTDMHIVIQRDLGTDQKFKTSIDLEMAGLGILFKFWPYPIRVTGGRVLIRPDHAIIENVTGVGLLGGEGMAHGRLEIRKTNDGKVILEPHVTFEGHDIPLDDLLLASVPEPQDQWLRDLYLSGSLGADGSIFNDEQGKIDFSVNVQLVDATARPFNRRFDIEKIAGSATITKNKLTIHEFTGKHGDSEIGMAGSVVRQNELWQLELQGYGTNLRCEDHVLDVIPRNEPAIEKLLQLVDTHEPVGTFNAQVIYSTSGSEPANYTLTVEPTGIEFSLRNQRVSLTQTAGSLVVEPGLVTFQDWAASTSAGSVRATGTIGLGEFITADVQFDVRADHFDAATRAVLPSPILAILEHLSFEGGYQLNDAVLKYQGADASQSALYFQSTVHVTDAKIDIGLPVTELTGTFSIEVDKQPQDERPKIELQAQLDQLRVAKRLIIPLTLHAQTSRTREWLQFDQVRGLLYGGLVLGGGHVQLTAPTKYHFALTVHNAPLDPILHPEKDEADLFARAAAADPYYSVDPHNSNGLPKLDTGQLSASLAIEATAGDPASRRGRGALEIRDARLYELPLAMALLQLLNFTLPTSGAFDRASARYLIDGDTIVFDDVRFEAPTVEIAGSGTMQYQSHDLDLIMFSKNPRAIDLGPMSDILDAFKNELVCIAVKGTLEEPESKVESFTGIRQTWDRIFGQSKKQRRQEPLRGSANRSGQ